MQYGQFDVHYDNYDEDIVLMKPECLIQNLIYGGTYVDFEGEITGINHTSGEKVVVNFHKKVSDTENSKISGKAYDSTGNQIYEMFGSWLDKVELRTLETGEVETLWEEPPMIPNAHM